MSPCETLINKSATIDREPALASWIRDIPALKHKPVDYSVELCVHVMKTHVVSFAVLTGTESSKILGSSRSQVIEELEDDSSGCAGANLYVHVHFQVSFRAHFIIEL